MIDNQFVSRTLHSSVLTARRVEPRVQVVELGRREVVVVLDLRAVVPADYSVDSRACRGALDAVRLCMECEQTR